MRSIILFLLAGISTFSYVNAQLLPLFLNNRDNAPIVNPAMQGIPLLLEKNVPEDYQTSFIVGLSTRYQWTGFDTHSPLTNFLRVQKRINMQGGSRLWVGGYFMNDRTGPLSMNMTGLNLSYQLFISNNSYIQFGLTGRMTQSILDKDKLIYGRNNDPTIDALNNSETFINAGAGILYSSPRFYIGASMPNTVAQNKMQLSRSLSDHYYGVVGTYFPLSQLEDQFLEISGWARHVDDDDYPLFWNTTVRYRSFFGNPHRFADDFGYPFWVGVGYDSVQALHGEIGFTYDKLRFTFIYTNYIGKGTIFGSGLEAGINLIL